jgi:hypothetical protein
VSIHLALLFSCDIHTLTARPFAPALSDGENFDSQHNLPAAHG